MSSLLQPRSFAPSWTSRSSRQGIPRTQTDIRASTVQLSDMLVSPRHSQRPAPFAPTSARSRDDFIFPATVADDDEVDEAVSDLQSSQYTLSDSSHDVSETADVPSVASTSTVHVGDMRSGTETPRDSRGRAFSPSGLSILLARQRRGEGSSSRPSSNAASNTATPTGQRSVSPLRESRDAREVLVSRALQPAADISFDIEPGPSTRSRHGTHSTGTSESAPLLADLEASCQPSYTNNNGYGSASTIKRSRLAKDKLFKVAEKLLTVASRDVFQQTLAIAVKSLPAVLLGSLLNILDGVSCESHYTSSLLYVIFNDVTHAYRRHDHLPKK